MSNFPSLWNLKENREVTIKSSIYAGKTAGDGNSCSMWEEKSNPQGHHLLSLINRSALTDGKRAPRPCPMQTDWQTNAGQEEWTSSRFTNGDAGGRRNGSRCCVERLCQSQGLNPWCLKTCSGFCHRIIFPLETLTYKACGTEAIVTPSPSLPSPCGLFPVGGMGKTIKLQTWAPSSCIRDLLWKVPKCFRPLIRGVESLP